MSDMPARTFSEASRSQQGHSQRFSPAKPWYQQHEAGSPSGSKMAAAGPSSPRSPPKRPWDSPREQTVASFGHDSGEEDELSDELPLHVHSGRSPRPQRTLSTKRKTNKGAMQASSPKRSKRAAADFSPIAKNTDASYHSETHSRGGSSPRDVPRAASAAPANRAEESAASGLSARLLSPDEIDTFLDLIYKHHPEPMTAESMRQSVDALYRDWEQFCARRQVPVRLAKKPLMDEYGKIFNGVYGSDAQAKARSIAHELSQRAANVSAGRDAVDDEQNPRPGSGSRHSLTRSMTDVESNDDEDEEDDNNDDDADNVDQGEGTTGGDGSSSSAPLLASKKKSDEGPDMSEGNQPGSSSKKPNIAQVGRNGLAVLPPGLFDILRTHLRDDILSSIMPSVRNDLTEQTRELFLQNQDLFGRIKEMEDRIRNQDLWIRHLLSRDPSDMATPPVGPHATATGMPGPEPKSKAFPAPGREPVHFGRPPRQGPMGSDTEMGINVPMADYFDGPGAMSPRQHPRNEAWRVPPPGAAGPHPYDGRMPSAGAGASVHPGSGFAPSSALGPGRWEAEGHPSGASRENPPERRPSYASEPAHLRPGSWQGEVQPGRDPRIHAHPSERHEQLDARYEPPVGPQYGQHRLSAGGDARRLSAFAGGGSGMGPGGPRGTAPGPAPLPSAGPAPSMVGMHDDFRRPGGPMHSRDPVMSTLDSGYETRRGHQPPSMPVGSQSESYFSSLGQTKAPLPPRAMAAASPEQVQRNKRGRPSKAEMASSSGGSSHPSAPSRPYLS